MSSHSKEKIRSRSRSRTHSYSKDEKKYAKKAQMTFKEENAPIGQNSNVNALFTTGNVPSLVDNNSSNLLNMAYVMNQQLVQSSQSFENKPEFMQFSHHSISNTANFPADNKKETPELVFANSLQNNMSENNMEGSFNLGK